MYFDPGTGSLMIQIILAFFTSIVTLGCVFRNSIKSFFRKIIKKNEKK